MKTDSHDLVSIIIPVFNVEAYVERCIYSVQKQRYKNIEMIIVDDGSTDGSGIICDAMAAQDHRITVIHKQNGGLSSARNVGMKAAHGKYIAFVDSDDFIHEEYISVMHSIAVESGVYMVICAYEKGKKNTFSTNQTNNSYDLYTSVQMLENWHAKLSLLETASWNKLIVRDILVQSDFKYPEGVFYEDVMTMHLLVKAADKIAVTGRKLYYYYQRQNSITKRLSNEKNIRDNLAAQDSRLAFFKENNYEGAVRRLMIGRQKYYMLMCCLANSQILKRELKMLFQDSYKLLIKYRETTWIEKITFYIFKIIFIRDS